jgi:hypothetical protein
MGRLAFRDHCNLQAGICQTRMYTVLFRLAHTFSEVVYGELSGRIRGEES